MHNKKEHTKARDEVRTLMLEDTRSAEKTEYLKLLAILVEAYEREHVSVLFGGGLHPISVKRRSRKSAR